MPAAASSGTHRVRRASRALRRSTISPENTRLLRRLVRGPRASGVDERLYPCAVVSHRRELSLALRGALRLELRGIVVKERLVEHLGETLLRRGRLLDHEAPLPSSPYTFSMRRRIRRNAACNLRQRRAQPARQVLVSDAHQLVL
jgi:hypothetical protein